MPSLCQAGIGCPGTGGTGLSLEKADASGLKRYGLRCRQSTLACILRINCKALDTAHAPLGT